MKLFRRIALLLLVTAGCCFLAAQQQAPAQPAGQQKATTSSGQNPDHAIRDAQRELAHTENEAAGEENKKKSSEEEEKDETAEFKQSPSVKWFASHTGLSLGGAYWLLVFVNFGIIAAAVIWGWKKNIPAMFRARGESIRRGIEEARRASEDANRRLSDIESRLSRLDSEIAEMRKNAEAEAVTEEERIKVAAEEERRKVLETAEQEIDAAAKAARRDLKAYAASLAVSLAEQKIHVDSATDQVLVSNFVRDLARNGGRDGR